MADVAAGDTRVAAVKEPVAAAPSAEPAQHEADSNQQPESATEQEPEQEQDADATEASNSNVPAQDEAKDEAAEEQDASKDSPSAATATQGEGEADAGGALPTFDDEDSDDAEIGRAAPKARPTASPLAEDDDEECVLPRVGGEGRGTNDG